MSDPHATHATDAVHHDPAHGHGHDAAADALDEHHDLHRPEEPAGTTLVGLIVPIAIVAVLILFR